MRNPSQRRSRAVAVAVRGCASAVAHLVLVLAMCATASAQTINWNNPAGGTFNVGSNWLGGVVPGASNHARFALNNTYTVSFANSPANSNLIMAAGTTTFVSSGTQVYTLGGFASFTGGTHTVTGLGFDIGVALRAGGNAIVTFNGGSDVTTTSLGFFGAGTSTMTFSGLGTTFRADNSLGLSNIGGTGVTTLMDFISSSDGTFSGVLNVGTALTGSTSATLRVASAAEVRAQRAVTVGASGQSGQAGTLTLTGATTRFIQTGGEAFTVGAASGSAGTIIVGSDLTTGTGLFTINPTGTLLISGLGGRLINGGSVLFNGGGFASMDGSQWSVAGTLDASAGQVVMKRGTVSAQSILGAENFTWDVASGFAGLTVNGGSLNCGSFHYDLHTTVPNGGQVQLQLVNGAAFDLIGDLTVGGEGTAFLKVQSGSSIECGELIVNAAPSQVTTVLVSGAGSTIVAEDLSLGAGVGEPILPVSMRIENGGAVTAGDSFGGRSSPSGNGAFSTSPRVERSRSQAPASSDNGR